MKHTTIITYLVLTTLFAGCVHEQPVPGFRLGKNIEVSLTTGVSPFAHCENMETSRGGALEDEPLEELYDYYLFQFSGTGDDAQLLLAPIYVQANPESNKQVVQLSASGTTTHRIVAVGNLGTSTYPWGVTAGTGGTTYADLRKITMALTTDHGAAIHVEGVDYPVMSATWTGVIEEGNDTAENPPIDLRFTVSVAKLVLTLDNRAGSKVTIDRIGLINMPSMLQLAAELGKNDEKMELTYASLTPRLVSVAPGDKYTHTFYLPANSQGIVEKIDAITRLNTFAPPHATYIQMLTTDDQGRRYTTSLHVGGYDAQTERFDFNVDHNTIYTLDYTIISNSDYYLDGRTDPYVGQNNFISSASPGTGAYIRTGIYPGKIAKKKIRFELDYSPNSVSTAAATFMGCGAAGNTACTYSVGAGTPSRISLYAGKSKTTLLDRPTAANTRHTDVIEFDFEAHTLTVAYDGAQSSAIPFNDTPDDVGKNELYLMANCVDGKATANSNMKLYSFKLWVDGVLMRDMRAMPASATVTLDGEQTPSAGMYDYVTQTLFTSLIDPSYGTGADEPFRFTVDPGWDGTVDGAKVEVYNPNEKTYTVPFLLGAYNYDMQIDWGDGTITDIPTGTRLTYPMLTHIYTTSGEHTISIYSPTGQMPNVNFGNSASASVAVVPAATSTNNHKKLVGLHSAMLNTGATNFNYVFNGCDRLTGALPDDLFIANPTINALQYTFYLCKRLDKALPAGLFANNPALVNFTYTFGGCTSLPGMHADLFVYNTAATTFSNVFNGCTGIESIPENLFVNNTAVTTFTSAFYGCSNAALTTIPAGLFRKNLNNISFSSTFYGCTALKTIPADLFKNNPAVISFANTFRSCSNLQAIPAGLFADNYEVTSFERTFQECTSLTDIPAGLFAGNPNVTTFYCTFLTCSGLTCAIPTGIFDDKAKVDTYGGTFSGCEKLSGEIPVGLFDSSPKVTSFSSTFNECKALQGSIPTRLFANHPDVTTFYNTFYNCNNLSGSIPAGLFDKCTEVTSFSGTFYDCQNLGGDIPAGLFDKNTKVTFFTNTFYNCNKLKTIPAGLFDNNSEVTMFDGTFRLCATIKDIPPRLFARNAKNTTFSNTFRESGVTVIPAGLFDNNPEVTTFSYTFYACKSLDGSIPEELFAHNSLVTSFAYTFYGCTSFTGSIPAKLFAVNPLVTSFGYTFANCSNLSGNIPAGLFDNNPLVTAFNQTFNNCYALSGYIPDGLFANNLLVTSFANVFDYANNLKLSKNIFVNATNTPATRFTHVTTAINFTYAFRTSATGYVTDDTRGEAPELWNYTYRVTPTSTGCFNGAAINAKLSNYASIPTSPIAWR